MNGLDGGHIEGAVAVAMVMAEIREDVARSLALNKDLSRLVERALELDQGMKVGWTRDGQPNPKQGEMGVAPGLPEGARLRMLGALEGCVAAFACGGTFTLEGNTGNMFAAWNNGGNISAERGAGNHAAHAMRDGRVVIRDGCGNDAGSKMEGGLLVIQGDTGRRCGNSMSGGTIVVHGDVGPSPGSGMSGGRVIINGRCPSVPEGVEMSTLSKAAVKELNSMLDDPTLRIPEDAVCLMATSDGLQNQAPDRISAGDWSSIGLVRGGGESVSSEIERDTMILLGERNGQNEAIGLPIPLLPVLDSPPRTSKGHLARQPFIVKSKARGIDIIALDADNLHEAAKLVPGSGGFILDMESLPTKSSQDLDGILVALRTLAGEEGVVMLSGELDSVELLHGLASRSMVDAVVSRTGDHSGRSACSALPLIGRNAASNGLAGASCLVGIHLDWQAGAADMAISCAAGSSFIISTCPEQTATAIEAWLKDLEAGLRGWLETLELNSVDQLTRKNLRALDYETASTSGLRLAGYGRPLPHWFAS